MLDPLLPWFLFIPLTLFVTLRQSDPLRLFANVIYEWSLKHSVFLEEKPKKVSSLYITPSPCTLDNKINVQTLIHRILDTEDYMGFELFLVENYRQFHTDGSTLWIFKLPILAIVAKIISPTHNERSTN